MKESLAARQAALLRQNAELDEQVEAIEQRRQQQQQQQQQQSRPSSSSSSSTAERRSRKKSAETSAEASASNDDDRGKEPDSGGEEERDGAAPVVPSALARSSSGRSRVNLPMDLSASIDSLGAATRGEEQAVASKRIATRTNSPNELIGKDESANGSSSAGGRGQRSTDNAGGGEGEGLGLEATVRYQKARLRVLQDEVEAASARIKELESSQTTLRSEADAAKAESAALAKKHQQAQQLLDKQRELT
jgi:hypothetical protein